MTINFETKILEPIRLQPQPDFEVEIIPAGLAEKWEKVAADQSQRLGVDETERVMSVLDKSVGALRRNGGSETTSFVGVVSHPEHGEIVVRGRGKTDGKSVSADGCFVVKGKGVPEKVLFQIETHAANLNEVEELVRIYEGLVQKAGWQETTEITMSFESLLKARRGELAAHGKPVMYATEPGVVEKIDVAPFLPRVVGRVGMQIGAVITGQTVGRFGAVEKNEKAKSMAPIVGLLKAK